MKQFKYKFSRGFTLVEILVVIAIVALIIGVVIASISSSKDKGADLEVKSVLSELQVKISQYDPVPGVTPYDTAFSVYNVPQRLIDLANKLNIPTSNFEFAIKKSNFAIAFPLKEEGKYYCIDSNNKSGKIDAPLTISTSASCGENVAGVVKDGGGSTGDVAPAVEDPGIREGDSVGEIGSSNSETCLYPALPDGCNYIEGPNYNPTTSCGRVISCDGGGIILPPDDDGVGVVLPPGGIGPGPGPMMAP